ncbi:MAG: hypothetical protein IJ740_13080 [Ruminococcus sp.]|nr:hypothetical protein [Ruminococcus sp.]
MSRILTILKNVLLCICTGIILGFFVMVVVWVFSNNKPDADKCLDLLRKASAISAFAVALIRVIFSVFSSAPVSRAMKLSESAATCDKGFEILKKRIQKTGNIDKKNAYRLILSALYTENEYFDESLDILKAVSFADLSDDMQQEYFNAYMYTYLLKGDIENAKKVYTEAEPYFKDPTPSVMHTLGVYEYSQGNYGKAKGYLLQSKSEDGSDRSICSCDMYLALCSLKEGSIDDAKALAKEAAYYSSTSVDEKNLAKLEHLINVITSAPITSEEEKAVQDTENTDDDPEPETETETESEPGQTEQEKGVKTDD